MSANATDASNFIESFQTKWYTERRAKTWTELLGLYDGEYSQPPSDAVRWVFRGDRTDAGLRTKLERAFDDFDVPYAEREKCEIETIRAFQRKAALYLEHEPDKDDILEWLAVMRHHGAPTRMLDCTYSFYLAVYMALAENTTGVVWVLNAARLNKPHVVKNKIEASTDHQKFEEIHHRLRQADDILNIRSMGDKLDDLAIACHLMKNPLPLVYAVNPFRLNRRLTSQQGLLLLMGDPKATFRDNLIPCFTGEDDVRRNVHQILLDACKAERNAILYELMKMNISNEVLFPGIDGFAKSLAERFAYREIFPPHA